MRNLTFIFLLFSSASFAYDISSLEEGLSLLSNEIEVSDSSANCSEDQVDENICSKYFDRFDRIKSRLKSLREDPVANGFSELVLAGAGDPKYYELQARLQKRLSRIVQRCLKKRTKSCYPDKRAADLDWLSKEFEIWKKDPIYRMPYAAVHCYQRAYLLSKDLTEKGLDVSLLQIGSAPTLIAKPLDENDNLLDFKPFDYKGIHWVVSIKVKDKSGKKKKLLLDPQFATRPMEYDEYFKKTIGQNCSKFDFKVNGRSISGPAIKSWECGYNEFSPSRIWKLAIFTNENFPKDPLIVTGESALKAPNSCGFDYAESARKAIESVNRDFNSIDYKIKTSDDTTQNILDAYRAQFQNLKATEKYLIESVESSRKEIERYKKENFKEVIKSERNFLKKYKRDLRLTRKLIKDYEEVIERVKGNLKD